MDAWIDVLSFLHQTKRFSDLFEPSRLKMCTVKTDHRVYDEAFFIGNTDCLANLFLYGCHLYEAKKYSQAASIFKKCL